MLHILLIILKIIGIVLLVILGVALLLVLLVLFVPVCYEAHLIKEESPFQADGRFGWLFHLTGGDFHYQDKRAVVRIRIGKKVLKTFCIPRGSEEVPSPSGNVTGGSSLPAGGEAAGTENPLPEETGPAAAAETAGSESAAADKARKPDNSGRETDHEDISEHGGLKRRNGKAKAEGKGQQESRSRKIRDALGRFPEKIGPFLTADAFAFYKRATGHLVRFLKTCRFRKFDGYLLIGTGQPDTTGELTGLLYLILPEAAGKYDLQADFYGEVFKTDTRLKGFIRLNHAAALIIRLLLDKEFRKLLHHILGKKSGKGKRKKKH